MAGKWHLGDDQSPTANPGGRGFDWFFSGTQNQSNPDPNPDRGLSPYPSPSPSPSPNPNPNPNQELSPEPLAAASIGQVYKGTLLDGREVAVKVQRSNKYAVS